MTYELAKRLKEAGFPQHPLGDYDQHDCGCENVNYCTPTLTELIEACGDYFYSLERHYGRPGMAYAEFPNPILWWEAQGIDRVIHTGSTSDEALANLFLVINNSPL